MKLGTKVTVIIMCFLVLVSITMVGTFAKWKPIRDAAQTVDVPTTNWNPSESYIVYAGINSSGDVVLSAANYSDIISFAVVGYTGTVAELIIPNEITVIYGEVEITGAVVRILAGQVEGFYFQDGVEYIGDKGEIDIKNNQLIVSLYIPASVVLIENSVFMGCVNLVSIELEASDDDIYMADYAFSECISLITVTQNERVIFGVRILIFYDTPYLG